MTSSKRKSPGNQPGASHSTNQQSNSITFTSSKGRRAVTSLWFAIRTLNGAALTPDDFALIREALAEIAEVLE